MQLSVVLEMSCGDCCADKAFGAPITARQNKGKLWHDESDEHKQLTEVAQKQACVHKRDVNIVHWHMHAKKQDISLWF